MLIYLYRFKKIVKIEVLNMNEIIYLSDKYDIAVRSGLHCAPLMHEALGTVKQGAVRFSFSYYNTSDEIKIAVSALKELAKEE